MSKNAFERTLDYCKKHIKELSKIGIEVVISNFYHSLGKCIQIFTCSNEYFYVCFHESTYKTNRTLISQETYDCEHSDNKGNISYEPFSVNFTYIEMINELTNLINQ